MVKKELIQTVFILILAVCFLCINVLDLKAQANEFFKPIPQ